MNALPYILPLMTAADAFVVFATIALTPKSALRRARLLKVSYFTTSIFGCYVVASLALLQIPTTYAAGTDLIIPFSVTSALAPVDCKKVTVNPDRSIAYDGKLSLGSVHLNSPQDLSPGEVQILGTDAYLALQQRCHLDLSAK